MRKLEELRHKIVTSTFAKEIQETKNDIEEWVKENQTKIIIACVLDLVLVNVKVFTMLPVTHVDIEIYNN